MENVNLSLLQTGLSLKNWLSLYLAPDPDKTKNFKIFSQKIKSTTLLIHHIKGQPAASTYV